MSATEELHKYCPICYHEKGGCDCEPDAYMVEAFGGRDDGLFFDLGEAKRFAEKQAKDYFSAWGVWQDWPVVPLFRKKSKPKAAAKQPLPPLPFSSPEFKQAWDDWEQSRKEQRKPIKPTARRLQLAKLAQWGEKRAIEALRNSTANGYQGIYEPKHGATKPERTRGEVFVA